MKLIFLWFSFTLSLFAQGIFYQINNVSILGSIHLADKSFYPLDKNIQQAFKQASYAVFEINLNQKAMHKMQKAIQTQGFYKNTNLKKQLSKESFQKLETLLEELHLHKKSYLNMKPWLLSIMLTSEALNKMGFSEKYGLDIVLLQRAKKQRKTILELESIEDQLHLLMQEDTQFEESLLEFNFQTNLHTDVKALMQAWKQADIKALESLVFTPLQKNVSLQGFYEQFVFERNKQMAEKIKVYFKDTSNHYFVVVGAAHLVGEKGIIKLLEKDSF